MFAIKEFESYEISVPEILDAIDAPRLFSAQDTILIKPNIVNGSPFPVTSSPKFCKPVIDYIQACSSAKIIIAEGCGDNVNDTPQLFSQLGFDTLAHEHDIELIDLNYEPLIKLENSENNIFPEIYLPEIAFNSMIFSLPVLKAHSLADITGTLKNMMGFAPPKYYSGSGIWKKAFFHEQMHESLIELNSYLKPDLTLMDASVGLSQYHLGGPECNPHVNKLIAGDDPYEVDQCAAKLLGQLPESIPHIINPKPG